ncbi:MAG: hypothetical protein WA919_17790 [Coleofasciculaceae cyanobacterium]
MGKIYSDQRKKGDGYWQLRSGSSLDVNCMKKQYQPAEVESANERSLSTLSRAITLSQGQFSLILVRCNYQLCTELMWSRLQEITELPLSELVLQESIKTLYTIILTARRGESVSALVVFGLDLVKVIDQILISTNQIRDEFRKSLTFPLVLWVTDEVLQKLTRFAPDFKSWAATSIKFELATERLLDLWNQTADQLFATILASDWGDFLPNEVIGLSPNCHLRQELESALRDLQSRQVNLRPEIIATWQFILGRDALSKDQINQALELYQQSLNFWQQEVSKQANNKQTLQPHASASSTDTPLPLDYVGILLHHISLSYCRQAQLQRLTSHGSWEKARDFLSQSIEVLTAAGRPEKVAQLTMQLAGVLQNQKNWTELQVLALQSLEQPLIRNSTVLLAQAYGFLATFAYAQSNWQDTKDLVEVAVQLLEESQSPQSWQKGLYLLLKARVQRRLGEPSIAINELEQALKLEKMLHHRRSSEVSVMHPHPQLYIDILEELRSLYFEQKQYLLAFQLKQEQHSIEQQYGFRTFLGAAPLQPQLQSKGRKQLSLNLTEELSPLENSAIGRQADVSRLLERLSRNDYKLTVIHGASGVGKSSLINAGLVPALESKIIGARVAMSVVQKVYRDWMGELDRLLTEALEKKQVILSEATIKEEENQDINSLAVEVQEVYQAKQEQDNEQDYKLGKVLRKLLLAYQSNLFTVLVFDQFEEFFFVCHNLTLRNQFFDFLRQCLNLPFVKIVFSMREDYIYYLLQCEYYCQLDAINNNILDRKLRYPLKDLSLEEATRVICTLAEASQFQLEETLINKLVQDLAGKTEVVRLIELQVVGSQLQAEKITTIEQYYALGSHPIACLVERSLLNLISDCGPENEDAVWQVLFSLTDYKGIRPLKTKAELLGGLSSSLSIYPYTATDDVITKKKGGCWEPGRWDKTPENKEEKLELILKILVDSGLVFRVLAETQNQYQLVHDYLVEPIRLKFEQRNQSKLLAQLEGNAIEIWRIRKQRLRAIAIGVAMGALAISAGVLEWRSELLRKQADELWINANLNALSASSEALFLSNKKFDALLEGLRAAKFLREAQTQNHNSSLVKPDTYLRVATVLSQSVYGTSERNRLEGHSDVVSHLSFSPDGQLIASASRDKTVKLWRLDGTLVDTLYGHSSSVTSVSFSPSSQLLASASWDGTIKLWSWDGRLVQTLVGHIGHVYSTSFSQDGRLIASAGGDGTVRVWTIKGKLLKTFSGHQGGVKWVSFSPTGETIASAGEDKTIKISTLEGKLLQTLEGHQDRVNCVVFSPDGKLLASASHDQTVKLWSRNGKLLKTFPKHGKWVLGVAFSADGRFVASASADNTLKLWNLQGRLLKTFKGHSDSVTAVSFSPTAKTTLLVNSEEDRQASLTNRVKLSPFQERALIREKPESQKKSFSLSERQSASGILMASASNDKTIKLWGSDEPSRLTLRGHQDNLRDVTFSPDGKLIATTGNDRTIKIWNRTGKLLKTLRGHTERIYAVSFSPDGKLLASASRDGTIKLWSLSGTLIRTLIGHSDWVLDVSFSPDSERLASASRDHTVKIWHREGTLIKTLTGHQARVNAVSFSPDGKLLASASDDKTLKLWKSEGKLLKTLRSHSNWVLDVSFSPNSERLASASYDDTVKIWSRKGELMSTLEGHSDSVAKVSFSPEGKILATTSWDSKVQLWRLDDTLIKTLEGHSERVTSLGWSNDGKALVTGSQDNTAIVWNLDLADLLQRSCNRLQDYLQNNRKVRQSDRALCQQPETEKKLSN